MDENPYQSPRSFQEAEKPTEKPPAKPPNRYARASYCGVVTIGGLMLWQFTIMEFYWTLNELATVPSLAEKRLMWSTYALIASPFGLLMAWWTLRAPESQCVSAVVVLTAVGWLVPALIGVVFFGLQ